MNVTGLKDGGFVVSWIDHAAHTIEAQKYDSSGSTIGGQFTVNITGTAPTDWGMTGVAGLEDGGFVITWNTTSNDAIYARRYNSSGTAVGNDFVVNDNAGTLDYAHVVGLSGGGFVIAWAHETDNLVKGKIYDADGVSADGEITLLTPPGGNMFNSYPRLAALNNGGFVIATLDELTNDGDSIARVYDATGTAETAMFTPHTTTAQIQNDIAVGALEDGGFVTVWADRAKDGSGFGIYMQRYSGKASSEGAIGSVSSVDYDNGTITADVGGVSTTMTITKQGLGVANTWYYQDFDTENGRSAALSDLNDAMDTVRSLSSRLGSQVSLLQVRSDYTEAVSENHSEGSDKLTQADINEEGANLLAMTTRSSLAMQALTFLGNSVGSITALFR